MIKKKHILFVVNVDWFFISHRISIAEAALKNGYEISLATTNTGFKNEIIRYGINFIDLKMTRSGTNFIKELFLILNIFKIYIILKPDIVHHVTLKPVIYGSIIAKLLNIKGVVNSISGLGYNFTEQRNSKIQNILTIMMRFGFNRNNVSIIFQNINDCEDLKKLNIIFIKNKLYLIKGSGINLNEFKSNIFPNFNRIVILFPARLLWDKGVRELFEATELLKNKYYSKIQFILAGMTDEENKASVPSKFIKKWDDGYYVKWIGHQKNMYNVYNSAHIVILPSYREGIPKSLIEACAMGRAIITTNAIGCKECVDEGINGFKVPIKNANYLSQVIEILVNNPSKIIEMGTASRIKAEKEFDIKYVINTHIHIYKLLI